VYQTLQTIILIYFAFDSIYSVLKSSVPKKGEKMGIKNNVDDDNNVECLRFDLLRWNNPLCHWFRI